MHSALLLMTVWSMLMPVPLQEDSSLAIADIDIRRPAPGANTFTATISNRADTAAVAVLDLRAEPGLWLLRNQQRQYGFELAPGETRKVEVEYEFERMSPQARLRVRLGPGYHDDAGYWRMTSIAFERWYDVGVGNPAALDIDGHFVRLERGPLEIFAWRGSRATERLEEIAAERARAIAAIGEVLDVTPSETIRLVFYPDSASKTSQTGHYGIGMARGRDIVEIYNDTVQLDPFHELAHVLIYELGDPPAVLDEGFAVYMSQRLGSDALRQLGSPGQSLDEAACIAMREGSAHTPAELIALEEIGSPESRARVAYPEAGSLVGFLIGRYGEKSLRALLRAAIAAEGSPSQRVERAIESTLEEDASVVLTAWRAHVQRACD